MPNTDAARLTALLAEHREDSTYPDTCLCEIEVPDRTEGHYAAHVAAVLAEAGVGFVADSDSSLRVALSQAEERLAQAERERDEAREGVLRAISGSPSKTLLKQLLDNADARAERAEAALADLRSRLAEMADRWDVPDEADDWEDDWMRGVNSQKRHTAQVLRALLDTEADRIGDDQ